MGHGIVLEHFITAKRYIKCKHKIKVVAISIAIFSVADYDRLDMIATISTNGKMPGNFELLPIGRQLKPETKRNFK